TVTTSTTQLTWYPVTNATSYEVAYDNCNNFTNPIIDNISGTSKITGTLEDGTTYYWRVRACSDGKYSPWSSVWSFKKSDTTTPPDPDEPLAQVTLKSPKNGITVTTSTTQLTWYPVTNATSYEVAYDTSNNFTNPITDNVSGTSKVTGTLQDGTTYYWRVRACTDSEYSPWSGVWSFNKVCPAPTPSGLGEIYELLPYTTCCYEGILRDSEKYKALDRLNYIRSLHGLNPVSYNYQDDIYTAKAALIIVANEKMNHKPDPSYKCYSEEGYTGSSTSNLYMCWGWRSQPPKTERFIDDWIIDDRVESLGHRRWLLSPFLKHTSYGRVDVPGFTGAAIKVINKNNADANVDFVAYPFQNYPGSLFLKDWYLSFSVVADKKNPWDNSSVNFHNVIIEIKDDNGKSLAVNSIKCNNEGYGVPNHLQWKVTGLKNGVKYTVNIKNVKVLGNNKDYEYWFKIN
ncbi:MAG: CAP domain-containing protein, partial [Syntrophomonadaceae bacterium]|nr:CAP domain-containing protein [Syntrophomonadaceae bacterium]